MGKDTIETNPGNDATYVAFTVPARVSRTTKPDTTLVNINGVEVGGSNVVVIAGPCAVENREQLLKRPGLFQVGGASILRGGAFKPASSPYKASGFGRRRIKLLEIRKETGLPIVTEVMDTRQFELVSGYADMIQIGSRNMQNYPLLKEAGMCRKPVLLGRGNDGNNRGVFTCSRIHT